MVQLQPLMDGEPGPDVAVVRIRVSYKGRFSQGEGGTWRYLGGDHFLESMPETTRYADLMFSLAEKVDGAVSVKYQLPGEELDPDSLISVNDDNDVKELFHEYQRALRLPGTPIKTFRLRLFLFPAAEDPYTPEDLAYFPASRASSADKIGRDAASAAGAGLPLPPSSAGGASSKEGGGSLARAFAKAAGSAGAGGASAGGHTRTPSSFSSELSCSSVPDAGGTAGSPDGTATPSAADTELAWEAGFRAGQEAAALAAQEEWHGLVAKRMQYLGHVQSDYILSAADAELGAAHWPEDTSGAASPWEHPHSMQHMQSSGPLFGGSGMASAGHEGSGALGALDDIDFDPDAEEAAEAAAEAADAARLQAVAAASQPASLAPSRQPSPRVQPLAASLAAPPPPLPAPALLHHPQPQAQPGAPPSQLLHQLGALPGAPRSPPRPPRPSSLLDSPLAPQTSVVMEDVENDVEFQSMFASKYEGGAAALQAQRRSPSVPPGGSLHGRGPATQLAAAAGGSSSMSLALGSEGSLPHASTALPIKQPAPGVDGAGGGATAAAAGAVVGGVAASPNSLLPTHISVFGDGITGLDLRHAAAVGCPAVQLPSHISEFGGEELEGGGEDTEQCRDRDANTMSVMKAALPDDDDLLADAMDALRRAPFPPDAVQLPTSFELLGGGGGGAAAAGVGGVVSPRLSPRLEAGGLGAAGGVGGRGEVGAGALPHQPGELQRSPSLEQLLSKVQRIDASQVNVLAKIGEGAFGEVSLAQCDTYGRVAVKWIKPTKVERHWASFWHEAELMSRLNHPNVLRFFGLVVEGPMVVGIMTEFAAAGSLASYLRSGVGFIPLKQRAQLALHAVNGMAYLHSLKVVHFDVKPDNLLVDGDWLSERGPAVKVADFGLSKHKYNTFCSNVHDLRGTLPYMAPEMIMDHTHVTEKADVWSLGVVFWEMLTLEVPFADMPPAQLIGALGLGRLRLTIPEWCEPDWRALMESCWVEDPALRPSCRQLATHLERIRDMAPR